MDRLKAMFELQKSFIEEFNVAMDSNTVHLAMIAEVVEALNETPWKPWKKHQAATDKGKYAEELADVMHFLVEAAIAAGITDEELFLAFAGKHAINVARQQEGY